MVQQNQWRDFTLRHRTSYRGKTARGYLGLEVSSTTGSFHAAKSSGNVFRVELESDGTACAQDTSRMKYQLQDELILG